MGPESSKGLHLTKSECKLLLSFIEKSEIIHCKITNAATNKLKNEEWTRITEKFNAKISSGARTPQQLRFKWDNIKKNYRKNKAAMQNNDIKTDNDDILDRVANLLDSTATDSSLNATVDTNVSDHAPSYKDHDGICAIEKFEFGDDAEPESCVTASDTIIDIVAPEEEGQAEIITTLKTDDQLLPDHINLEKVIDCGTNTKHTLVMSGMATINNKTSGYKRKQDKHCDDGRAARNKAIEEYYVLKKKFLEAKSEEILLQNEKLKLEIEVLKQKKILKKKAEFESSKSI